MSTLRSRRPVRLLLALSAVVAAIGGGFLTSLPSSATAVLTVSPATNTWVTPSSTTLLTGLSVTGDTTDQLQATVSTSLGTLSLANTTNLTLGYGNSWTGTSSITFSGLQSDVDNGLASISLVAGSATGTATISLTAMVAQANYNYLAPNQHFYQYVACSNCTWTSADAAAQTMSLDGQQGYLATIPNAVVNSFISTKIANATDVWFGARAYESIATDGTQGFATVNSTTYARVWRWTEGASESPIAGGIISECPNQTLTCTFANSGSFYSSWASQEPNNSSGSTTTAYQGEYVAVTNWNGTSGAWNDLSPTASGAQGYVVEYGGKTNSNSSLGTGFAGVVTATSNVDVETTAAVPAAPTITGTAGNAALTVSWNPPDDGGSVITSYLVSTNGTTWNPIATTSSSGVVNGNVVTTVTATLSSLTNGNPYSVEIEAVNSVGNSPASNTVVVTPITVPGAPTGVAATPQNAAASVSWTAPTTTGGTPITGYTVTAAPGGATVSCTSPCVLSGLTNGTAYTFTVTATNAAGTSAPSSASNSVVPATVPGAPTSPSAVSGSASATVSWTAPAGTGGSTITGYVVTASPGGATAACLSSPCVIVGLTNGQAYTFTVTATNSVGTSASSAPSGSVTPYPLLTRPSAPTGVSAAGGNHSVSVSWTAPASNGGAAITGYTVTASPGGASVTCASSPCVVTGLTNGTTYAFTVMATNSVGNSAGATVNATPVSPVAVAPASPTNVSATYGNGSATVSWLAPGATGGATVTGYVVTASPGGETATCTASPCLVDGLTAGMTYTFTVVAVTASGQTSPTSPPTAPATATNSEPTGGSTAETPSGNGYWSLGSTGTLGAYGQAGSFGSENGQTLNAPVVGVASTGSGDGYWEVGSDGGVFSFGDAGFYGSLSGSALNQPIVDVATTTDSRGYWLVAADGGVFTFGDAQFYGSAAGTALNQPIVGINPSPDGRGYWLIGADGGVFTFGDAQFYGSYAGGYLNEPIVGMAPTPDGHGYLLVAADGGVFTFGDARFYGSLGGSSGNDIVGVVANDNLGYQLIGDTGKSFSFGAAS